MNHHRAAPWGGGGRATFCTRVRRSLASQPSAAKRTIASGGTPLASSDWIACLTLTVFPTRRGPRSKYKPPRCRLSRHGDRYPRPLSRTSRRSWSASAQSGDRHHGFIRAISWAICPILVGMLIPPNARYGSYPIRFRRQARKKVYFSACERAEKYTYFLAGRRSGSVSAGGTACPGGSRGD